MTKKHLLFGVMIAVLCLGAFVGTSSAQRRGGLHLNISIGSPYRSYYPGYYRAPRVIYRPQVYYTPRVYYPTYDPYYSSGYYNSGYYAPAYNTGYDYGYRRHRSRDHCNYYDHRRY
jgi:hypothetical protein